MVNVALIIFCTLAGILFKYYGLIAKEAYKGINVFILYIALPAVSFKYIPQLSLSKGLIFPALSSLLVMIGAYIFMYCYSKYKKYNRRTRSSLEIASAYSNTSFIGFPLIIAYYSEQDLGIAILCDQSMFLLLSTIGVISALKGNKGSKSPLTLKVVLKRFVSFPPAIACILAIVLSSLFDMTKAEPFFDKLTATVGPLALFSLGLQLNIKGWKERVSQISTILLYKLLLAPLLVLIAALVLDIEANTARISIFEASMPTVITASIIAEQFHLNDKLINLTIGMSIVVGFFTTGLWTLVINSFF
ncbi:AEC family transporter [Sphingobacterium sp. LRF_L2]|uniref:AEC family transporter n=1 Tax=Sphingobacterium sp. LRF_L2 TaxID=3369421 RepID=UPI003F5EC39A